MKRKILSFTILLFVSYSQFCFGSHPYVRNFSKKAINAGAQTWDMIQHKNDWMYFANNSGLLEFDGNKWAVYHIDNYTNVRSLLYDENKDRIYAGGYNTFGYYERNKSGLLEFRSISKYLDSKNNVFTEIWNINKLNDNIFFQSDNDVFRLKGKTLKHFHFNDKIITSAVVHNLMIVAQQKNGVVFLNGDMFLPFPNSEILKGKKVCSILALGNNEILFMTDFNGIFIFDGEKVKPYNTNIDGFIEKNQIFCATIQNNMLAIGTVRGGLVVKNLKDNSTVYSNIQTGLQNNTVLSISFDKIGNIWLGLDKGIDYVMINAPISDLFGNPGVYGAGYTSLLRSSTLYLGTNQGLFSTNYPLSESPEPAAIHLIAGIHGQVWSLDSIQNTLFCSSDNGLYTIQNNTVHQISGLNGTWKVKPMKSHPDKILGASYLGLFILQKQHNQWIFSNYIKGFSEAGGMFEEDSDGNIWISHWMKGVFRLKLNEKLDSITKTEYYGIEKGFPSTNNNTIFSHDGKMCFSTENGFFQYEPKTDHVVPFKWLNRLLGVPPHSVRISETPDRDIWSVSGSQIRVALQKSHTYLIDSVSFFPLKDKQVPGFEQISYLNKNRMLISTEDGFSVINTSKLGTDETQCKLTIRNVFITNNKDSIFTGYISQQNPKQIPEFDSKHNSVRFEFVGTEYRSANAMLYSCYLENYDNQWSSFSAVNTKEFTKLSAGTYIFRVKAIDLYNKKTVETSYKFTILPPWYLSKTAWLIYGISILIALYFLIIVIKNQSEKAVKAMEQRKEKEMFEKEEKYLLEKKEKEKEIIALKNQKLQYELRHKSQDLASSTMNLIRKNEILMDINNNLGKIQDEISGIEPAQNSAKRIRRMQDDIRKNIEHDNNWKKFQENFDMVYENYLKRLSEQYPALTVSDKKLCAYLKMDLSSKDIAPLLNMSYRSVEMSRYRLRKKLNLERDINLTDFLQNF